MVDYLYEHGKPFSKILVKPIQEWKRRILEDNLASMIVISGGVGQGKTTFAVQIAEEYQGCPIDFNKQIAMGGSDFVKKILDCQKENIKVLIYDEGGDFNSRGAISKFNRMLNEVFDKMRAFKVFVIMCLPNPAVLDLDIFGKNVLRAGVQCYGKKQNKGYGEFRTYSLVRYAKVIRLLKDRKTTIPDVAFNWVSPNSYGHRLNLSPERETELSKVSLEAKEESLKKYIEEEKDILPDVTGLITSEQIAKSSGFSYTHVVKTLKYNNKKPVEQIGRVKYYDPAIVREILKI